MDITLYIIWGAGGAFAYAAPRSLLSYYESRIAGRSTVRHVLEFVVAILIGLIGSAGIGPVIADTFHRTGQNEGRALAVLMGLVANPISPLLVNVLSDQVLRRLGAPIRRPRK